MDESKGDRMLRVFEAKDGVVRSRLVRCGCTVCGMNQVVEVTEHDPTTFSPTIGDQDWDPVMRDVFDAHLRFDRDCESEGGTFTVTLINGKKFAREF